MRIAVFEVPRVERTILEPHFALSSLFTFFEIAFVLRTIFEGFDSPAVRLISDNFTLVSVIFPLYFTLSIELVLFEMTHDSVFSLFELSLPFELSIFELAFVHFSIWIIVDTLVMHQVALPVAHIFVTLGP